MRFINVFVLAVFVFAGQTAMADFKTVTRVNEVRLSELQLPASVNGMISFKGCGICDLQTANVNAATRYELNGESISLPEFRRALAIVTDRDSTIVAVKHHLDTNLVTLISIRL